MIKAEVSNKLVKIKGVGTGEELALDVLRLIKGLYGDIYNKDTCLKLGAKDFRFSLIHYIDEVFDEVEEEFK